MMKFKKTIISDLQTDAINSIESNDGVLLYTCCDEAITCLNMQTGTKQTFYSAAANQTDDEINCLKLFNLSGGNTGGYLLVANNQYLQVFDVNTCKQVSKYKFFKETINSIELNSLRNSVACSDDSGEIKILDLRVKKDKQMSLPTLTMRKSLLSHSNICFSVKFHPLNDNVLFSGSFDCTVLKWDLRSIKNSASKPYLNQIDINQTLSSDQQDSMVSTMTPNFVHNIHLSEVTSPGGGDRKCMLTCGIENGLCLLYDADTCQYYSREQLQTFNCALTQMANVDLNTQIKSRLGVLQQQVMAGTGNGKSIEFFVIKENSNHTKYSIEKLDSLQINHNKKVNCIKYVDDKLYIGDTTKSLTIYDLNDTHD